MENITLKDIAKALNLSTSTVSRALRGSYEISPETKKLVLDYAEKVRYSPNPIALSLKENRSRSIGVIVPEIANHFFSQAIDGIEAIAYHRGYHVVIFQSHESQEREIANLQHLISRKVDGVLMSISGFTEDFEHLEKLKENNFPIVYFDRIPETLEVYKVVADNFEGAFKATEHLIQSGRKKIVHLTSPAHLSTVKERLAGYRAALEKYHIAYNENLVRFCGFGAEEAQNTVLQLLREHKPDAFFIASDRLALNCLSVIKEQKLNVPEEVALVGFTNLRVSHLLSPSLSTVVQPAFEMGQAAAEMLLDLIEKKSKSQQAKTLKLPTSLTIRRSSF